LRFLALGLVCIGVAASSLGPAKGNLVIVGGGTVGPEIVDRFIALAGGRDAAFVWIPTASGDDPRVDPASTFLGKARCTHIAVLHTRDPKVADTEAFVRPLRSARGVWFEGGRHDSGVLHGARRGLRQRDHDVPATRGRARLPAQQRHRPASAHPAPREGPAPGDRPPPRPARHRARRKSSTATASRSSAGARSRSTTPRTRRDPAAKPTTSSSPAPGSTSRSGGSHAARPPRPAVPDFYL
jgi:hypothetical protein